MAKYSAIKAAVNAYIKQNGRKEITGMILNSVLNATIESLGRFFQFAGGAMPTDDPGTPDQNVCYLATEPGVYTKFGGIVIENEEVALLFWNGTWTKQRILIGIREVTASVDNQVGTPSVDVSFSGGVLTLTFHNLKGETGDPAGFGTIGADVTGGVGTPGVSVETSGDNDAKNIMFHFTNLKGETGVTSVVATIDNTSGTPSCQVSLAGGVLTLAFSGLKGLKGDTGVSADYPITIYNGLDSDATDQALAAAQGKVLDEKISLLDAEVDNGIETRSASDSVTTKKVEIDFGDYPLRDYWINDENKYGTSDIYKHILVPVCPGDVLLVTANSTNTATLAWMASKKVPSSGGTPPFAPGETKFTIPAGETMKIIAPAGALYLYVYRGAGDAYTSTPESLFRISNLLNDEIFTETETIKTKIILRDENQDILPVNVSNGGLIQSSSTSGDRGYYMPVQAGQKVRLQAATSTQHYIKYGFCASVPGVGTQLTNYYVSPKISSIDDIIEVLYDGYFFCFRNTGYFTQLFQFSIIETEKAWDGKANKATTLEGYGITDAYTKTEVNELRNSFALTENVPGNGSDFAFSPYIAGVIPGNTYRVYIKNTDVSMDGVDIPNDRYRFAIYFYDSNKSNSVRVAGTLVNKPLKESYDVVAPSGSAYMRVGIRCSASDSLQMMFKDVTAEGVSSLAGILDANPDSEFIPKMMSAKKRYFTSTNNENPTPYVIAHLSDIHGNWDNVSRFLEWCNHYSDKIDLLVNSGDTMENTFNSNISGYDAIDGVDNILVVIGNHDTRSSVDTSQWQAHVGLDAYNKFIAPHISSWGVTQPSNAAAEGKCYYYKDDATRKLRIICVDIMGYDSTQDSWVQGLLADALTNAYHVLIVTHFLPARSYAERDEPSHEVIECNYSSLYPSGSDSSNLTAYNTNSYLLGASVDTFIQGGGLFVGYLGGHYHREIVAKHAKYPEQLFFAVGASMAGETRDYNHIVGTRDRDEFEIVSIDTYTKTITLYKVGANVDKYGRHKNSICINYETATIKAEAF